MFLYLNTSRHAVYAGRTYTHPIEEWTLRPWLRSLLAECPSVLFPVFSRLHEPDYPTMYTQTTSM